VAIDVLGAERIMQEPDPPLDPLEHLVPGLHEAGEVGAFSFGYRATKRAAGLDLSNIRVISSQGCVSPNRPIAR
jgi:hypothetical protein